MPHLSISDLHVSFRTSGEAVEAVRGVSLEVGRGESVALVGESGSGKSVTALSVLRLLPYPQAWHPGGRIEFEGESLLDAPPAAMRSLRGRRISMIFQEPMTSLNPLHTVEKQVREALRLHQSIGAAAAASGSSSCSISSTSAMPSFASPPTPTSSPAASASGS